MRTTIFDQYFTTQIASGDPWDCWECPGVRNKDGYVSACTSGQSGRAHRLAFVVWHGRPIAGGMEIMHLCDNPPCVNPCHLKEGTHRENMLDSHAKGRATTVIQTPESLAKMRANTPRGERHWMKNKEKRKQRLGENNGNSKLTWEQVRDIRHLRSEGWLLKPLAQKFGVSLPLVSQIVRTQIWDEDGYEARKATPKRAPYRAPEIRMPQMGRPGAMSNSTPLSWEDVREIRRLRAERGLTQTVLAAMFGVTQACISRILLCRCWKPEHDLSS